MKIEVWSDFVCPYCYIGRRRLELALGNMAFKDNVIIKYKSYELDPKSQKTQKSTTDNIKRMNERLVDQAAEVGLTYNVASMQYTNTFDAHRVAKLAAKQGKGNDMVERLFQAFFTEGELLSDHETLIKLAQEVGIDSKDVKEILHSRKFTSIVRDDEEEALQMEVIEAPFFVFNESYAISGAQPLDVFKEVLSSVWEEECHNPELQSLALKSNQTTFCVGDQCDVDEDLNLKNK